MKIFVYTFLIGFCIGLCKSLKEKIEELKSFNEYFYWIRVLKISKNFSEITKNDINIAYKKQAMIYHPDKYTGSHRMMQDINRAREDGLKYVENN